MLGNTEAAAEKAVAPRTSRRVADTRVGLQSMAKTWFGIHCCEVVVGWYREEGLCDKVGVFLSLPCTDNAWVLVQGKKRRKTLP